MSAPVPCACRIEGTVERATDPCFPPDSISMISVRRFGTARPIPPYSNGRFPLGVGKPFALTKRMLDRGAPFCGNLCEVCSSICTRLERCNPCDDRRTICRARKLHILPHCGLNNDRE